MPQKIKILCKFHLVKKIKARKTFPIVSKFMSMDLSHEKLQLLMHGEKTSRVFPLPKDREKKCSISDLNLKGIFVICNELSKSPPGHLLYFS